ncbi:hypothetical protein HRG84_02960 [Flavisolibacter sp. BT320]|nr:hypothetical protein [Flavisolibacter longurius]
MKTLTTIGVALLLQVAVVQNTAAQTASGSVDFFGVSMQVPAYKATAYQGPLTTLSIKTYVEGLDTASLQPFLAVLLAYKAQHHPDDWLYYQLVRKVAQQISPKTDNYYQYTFYKWWFLVQSGYDARLAVAGDYLLFYVQCDESIYNIPSKIIDNRQYVCLNYHDYGSIDFEQARFTDATPFAVAGARPFSYKVSSLPDFSAEAYTEKEVQFSDGLREYAFRIKVNPQVKTLFTNYPAVDYDLQFNMPLSKATYESLIPSLKKQVKGLKPKDGVEFLMRFTRYAFLFKPDTEVFGTEKRLSPEQTLLYEYSDCEDRAALFFFLVKELYDLPMLVLTYPEHVTVAVQFDKAYGKTIAYNGKQYTICEPSPQGVDLRIGQLLPQLDKKTYHIAYAYQPK